MNLSLKKAPSNWVLQFTILFLIITDLAVLFDVPILRQFSSFIFLTFIPGFLILLILKLYKLGWLERIILSVGLSATFSMLFGLLINSLSLAVGYPRPLSTVPLLVSFSMSAIVLAIIASLRNRDIPFVFPALGLSTHEKALLIVPTLFPLLSFLGMRIMNATDSNIVLMLLLILIPAYIVFIALFRSRISDRFYPFLAFSISISLVLMLPLRVHHIVGSDVHSMYYLFQLTSSEGHWSLFSRGLLDATISISLLPTIYQVYLDINPEYLFNLLTPFLFSLSPLVVYVISNKYVGGFSAFAASFLFMAQFSFLWAADSANTAMAILFIALALMVLFHDGINEIAKRLLFILLAFSSILSHYSSSYIFLFLLLFTWTGMKVIPWLIPRIRESSVRPDDLTGRESKIDSMTGMAMPAGDVIAPRTAATAIGTAQSARGVSVTMITLFFVLLFIWYSQITIAPFDIGVGFIRETLFNLPRWFVLESRGPTITAAVGVNIATPPQEIRLIASWLTVVLTGIGVLGTMARYKKMVAVVGGNWEKPEFLKRKLEADFLVLSMACSALLVATAVLPFVSRGYSMERTYSLAMVILSLFFCIGGITLARWMRLASHWVILLVLIPFFMSTTGTVYQLLGYPASLMLNSTGTEYNNLYVYDEDSHAARWLIQRAQENVEIFPSGTRGSNVLVSQGGVPFSRVKDALVMVSPARVVNAYVFLRRADTTVSQVVTTYPYLFAGKSKLYTAGGAEIYR